MINKGEWQEFERKEMIREHLDIEQKFRILDALYEEALFLGIFPLSDQLEGIDIDIKVAKVVNSVSKAA